MPKSRRYFPSNTAYFITNRVAEGLPFVPNRYINLMLYGVLARAAFKHPGITLCSFLFLGNHFHMILVLRSDPGELKSFMNFVDGEIAKLVVRWLGKRNVKIWAQNYHAAPLLTSESCLKETVYTFANPVTANLSATASDWIGCSSYYSLESPTPRRYKMMNPGLVTRLPNGRFKKRLVKVLVGELNELNSPEYELKLSPFAWMECYSDTRGKCPEGMKRRLYTQLRQEEIDAAKRRKAEKREVADPDQLAEQNPHKSYRPKKFGKRVFCISSDPEIRLGFILLFKELCRMAAVAYSTWVTGFIDMPVPHGMFFPPRGPRGSILPVH